MNRMHEVFDKVDLEKIPKFSDLKLEVDNIVEHSSWWDRYGVDYAVILGFGLVLVPTSLLLMHNDNWVSIALGAFLLGWCHASFGTKTGHLAAHGALCENKFLRRLLSVFFVEIIGSFSEELSYNIHIKEHHPYTNIIGRGDSSTWRVPFLPRYIYMFLAPVLLPPLTPLVSIYGLVKQRSFLGLLKYIVLTGTGLTVIIRLLMEVSGFSLVNSLLIVWASRSVFSIPYIHVNIFQHIGLPMYSQENKPVRLYQMATGVLNLPSNPILDLAFGHSIISSHVEHHLFPKLSDNMCLKIKPVVSRFLKEGGLPYNEKSYMDRVFYFLENYEKLMVLAPPITHFVGIQ